ncbi:MAG: nucleotidyltransferase family protein, partial [Clostridia bacterium]|nr:nucleotidyltransferase family protein [Clostridia bacterium]
MHTVGIICEYNPLHAGHAYLLERVREAETVICLMSGVFTQRGEAALLPPRYRAEMAIRAGADLVLELPYPFAAASAEHFATAGVRALSALGADTLAFGSERADKSALARAAALTLTPEFAKKVANVAENTGDAAAYFAALGENLGANDILALAYTRAILAENIPMEIYPVLRRGAGYHDSDADAAYPSATALRAALARGEDITDKLPACVREVWQRALAAGHAPADTAALGSVLLAELRRGAQSPTTGGEIRYSAIAECEGGLGVHLARAAGEATDYTSLCRAAATKRYTDARIRRALLYILTGVTREDLVAPPAYLRLLGASARGREYLAKTRKSRTVPVVTKPADIAALGESAARARALSALAEGLYGLCTPPPQLP